jgi:hypothetical protein
VRKNPELQVYAKGRSGRYRARFPDGEEYDGLWDEVNDLYAGYDVYRERAGDRRIPLVVLEPVR